MFSVKEMFFDKVMESFDVSVMFFVFDDRESFKVGFDEIDKRSFRSVNFNVTEFSSSIHLDGDEFRINSD